MWCGCVIACVHRKKESSFVFGGEPRAAAGELAATTAQRHRETAQSKMGVGVCVSVCFFVGVGPATHARAWRRGDREEARGEVGR